MSQNMYSIQLLNDLHNHFPELLYNHRRFQNVQDVLQYIRTVANMSPLSHGQQQYNSRQNMAQPSTSYRQNATVAPPPPAAAGLYNTIPVNNTIPQTYVTTMFEENIPTPTRVRMPINTNPTVLMSTLLGGLFGDIMSGGMEGINLNTFLNERVPVYPTNEEIDNASSIMIQQRRNQDEICAICQDNFEANQEIRCLTYCRHSFHRDCIDTWFRGNVHCPTCRHDIRELNENQHNNYNNINRNDRQYNQNSPPPVPDNHRRTNIRRADNNE
jgi:hypothetical protein